jgi:hypothetical protein
MATYNDATVSIQSGTGTYTCPTGKFARVSLRAANDGNQNSVTVAGVSGIFGINTAAINGHREVILTAAETITAGTGTISWTALEFSQP